MRTVHDATDPISRRHSVRAGVGRWQRVWFFPFAIVCLLFVADSARADDDNDGPVRFHEVEGWRGTLVATARANPATMAMHDELLRKTGGKGAHWNFQFNVFVSVDFVLDEYESDPSVWTGKVTGSEYSAGYHYFVHMPERHANDPDWKGYVETEWSYDANGALGFKDDARVELQFHRERGWSVRMPSGRLPTEVRSSLFRHHPTKEEQNPDHDLMIGPDYSSRETLKVSATGMGSTENHPYPKTVSVLLGQSDKHEGSFPLIYGNMGVAPDVIWDYTVYLEPTSMEELRLVIEEPTSYKTWRPATTLDAAAGPPLEVTAYVETAKGATPKVKVEQFIWELQDTSFEPGVALNFPVLAGDTEFDLKLDATGGYFTLSPNKQKVTRVVQQGFRDTVSVVPFDWGGWSNLQVTAVMADGRRVRGKLKGKTELGLRVPKRAPDSKIADVWKEKNKSGADDLDDENDPIGDGRKGDGFTLYEEYRGFVVKGEHVDGDPKKKDFFVLNLIGADAEMGIGLFEALSEFRVHRLEPNEMDVALREVNGHWARGAHEVDQHGVVLAAAGSAAALAGAPADVFGAMTYSIDGADKGLVFQPASTRIIGILPDGHPESLFSKPGNLSASDGSVTFFRAVAHELMHSVGVEEHGDGDGQAEFVFVSPKHPKNTVGRPYYARKDAAEKPVPLLNEQGHDMAAIIYPRYAVERAKWVNFNRDVLIGKPGEYGYPRMAEDDFQNVCEYEMSDTFALAGQVGAEHGQHAGNQDCIMRYHFANFYPFTGRTDAFYVIEPGTEKIGLELCHSPAGTGVNATGHEPQSRHGDAWPGTGNCAAKICPNDAATPRKAALPVK